MDDEDEKRTHQGIDGVGLDASAFEQLAEPFDDSRPQIMDEVKQMSERPFGLPNGRARQNGQTSEPERCLRSNGDDVPCPADLLPSLPQNGTSSAA